MKRHSANRVEPYGQHNLNNAIEKDNRKKHQKFRNAAQKTKFHNNALNAVIDAKTDARKWRRYCSMKRQGGEKTKVERRTTSLGIDKEPAHLHNTKLDTLRGTSIKSRGQAYDNVDSAINPRTITDQNSTLIRYFHDLGTDETGNNIEIDLDYLEDLFKKGANINCTDRFGQTVLHEAARSWHTDVAQFLLDHGADVNHGDNYGRTALHMAAAMDYPEMCAFLIRREATKEAYTNDQLQTAVHFAAKNDAVNSLRVLIKLGCKYEDVRDYKMRTPLHVAAELDRSETARFLLEIGAEARVVDEFGATAVSIMINKMPPAAKLALDQFHTTERATRWQYYYLNSLEPLKPNDERTGHPQTALQMTVQRNQYDIVTHEAIMKLIDVKWKKFGRFRALLGIGFNLVFILLWTIQGLLVDYDRRHDYNMPGDWWRILLFLLAIVFTAKQIFDELTEYFSSKKNHKNWREWKEEQIKRDMEYCHPRWPDEEKYLDSEIEELDNMSPQYFNDFWNIFDWICYTLLTVCVLTHIIDVANHTNFVARLHIRIMAVTIILLWLRLMKNARAFSSVGPFIVMMSHMMGNVMQFVVLYIEFYIPYACAFWMLFGGTKIIEKYQGLPASQNVTEEIYTKVEGYDTVDALLFSMFRLTLVDEYDYSGMKSVDYIMTDILVGTWFALSSIVMLNLFIALMSDTFQRVYDNAKANAVMQKAITILSIEEGLNKANRDKFRAYIHEKCAPKKEFYDDDMAGDGSEDLKKITTQIKEQLDNLEEQLHDAVEPDRLGLNSGSGAAPLPNNAGDPPATAPPSLGATQRSLEGIQPRSQRSSLATVMIGLQGRLENLEEDITSIRSVQQQQAERYKKDMASVKSALHQLLAITGEAMHQGGGGGGRPTSRSSTRHRSIPSRDSHTSPLDPAVHSADHSRHGEPVIRPGRAASPMSTSPGVSPQRQAMEADWDRMERQRQADLQQLRKEISEKQQLQTTSSMLDTAATHSDEAEDRGGQGGGERP